MFIGIKTYNFRFRQFTETKTWRQSFQSYIQKNFSDLEFSRDNLFAKLKAGILESNKTGIPQKYIDEFLEIELRSFFVNLYRIKRIIEQNKLSIAKWETKMKLDNQNKNKAPDNKE